MLRQLSRSLAFLPILFVLSPLQADPPVNPGGEPKKLQVKPQPPLIGDPDEPVSPLLPRDLDEPKPVTKTSVIVPATEDTNKRFEVIVVAPSDKPMPTEGPVGIGFFNHSERDIVLEINNQTVKLASQYYVQVKLPREFTWREKEGVFQKTKVPMNADGVEIVFRR